MIKRVNKKTIEIDPNRKTAKEVINLPTGPYFPIPKIAQSISNTPYNSSI